MYLYSRILQLSANLVCSDIQPCRVCTRLIGHARILLAGNVYQQFFIISEKPNIFWEDFQTWTGCHTSVYYYYGDLLWFYCLHPLYLHMVGCTKLTFNMIYIFLSCVCPSVSICWWVEPLQGRVFDSSKLLEIRNDLFSTVSQLDCFSPRCPSLPACQHFSSITAPFAPVITSHLLWPTFTIIVLHGDHHRH